MAHAYCQRHHFFIHILIIILVGALKGETAPKTIYACQRADLKVLYNHIKRMT